MKFDTKTCVIAAIAAILILGFVAMAMRSMKKCSCQDAELLTGEGAENSFGR